MNPKLKRIWLKFLYLSKIVKIFIFTVIIFFFLFNLDFLFGIASFSISNEEMFVNNIQINFWINILIFCIILILLELIAFFLLTIISVFDFIILFITLLGSLCITCLKNYYTGCDILWSIPFTNFKFYRIWNDDDRVFLFRKALSDFYERNEKINIKWDQTELLNMLSPYERKAEILDVIHNYINLKFLSNNKAGPLDLSDLSSSLENLTNFFYGYPGLSVACTIAILLGSKYFFLCDLEEPLSFENKDQLRSYIADIFSIIIKNEEQPTFYDKLIEFFSLNWFFNFWESFFRGCWKYLKYIVKKIKNFFKK